MGYEQKKLDRLMSSLSDGDRESVIAFADFLYSRAESPPKRPVLQSVNKIPRPAEESVPAALKRLRLSYPMLDASSLLSEASDLMSGHLLLGRAAVDVIDEMEVLFLRHYRKYCDGMVNKC